MVEKSKSDTAYKLIEGIFGSRDIGEIKTSASEFVTAAENLEGMHMWSLCQRFKDILLKQTEIYSTQPLSSKNNVVIVPPEHAPIILLYSCVPINGIPLDMISGLKKFIARCDEFVPPVYDAITVAEINRVVNAAQKTYRIVELIAPKQPMYILRFNNSHIEHNSQCGIPDNGEQTATIFLFHLKEKGLFNRIYIFAHELGHALHLALTKNIDIIPDGFDKFNDCIHVHFETLKDKQEAFADAVALAILHIKGLRVHLPTEHCKYMSPYFAKYIRAITENIFHTTSPEKYND